VVAAAGLFQNERSRGTKPSWGYAFPLYYYRGGGKFLTPLFGWDRSRSDKYMYPLTPLVGIRGGDHTGGWVFPLFSHRAAKDGSNSRGWFLWGGYRRYGRHLTSGMFPFYSYKSDGSAKLAGTEGAGTGSFGRDMFVFPSFWYENRVSVWRTGRGENGGGQLAMSATKKNGMFPLWSYSRQKAADGQATVRSSVVLFLHDYLRRTGTKAGQVDNYVRSRVLWRLWHFERLNDDVSVDVFPAITYDRRGAGFRKTSFLWRLFRYERDGRSRKLDVLFVPVLRTGKGVEPEGKERANG